MRVERSVDFPNSQGPDKAPSIQAPLLKNLVPIFRDDVKIVMDMIGAAEHQALSSVRVMALILGSSKSPSYLKGEPEKIIPRSKRVEFEGLDHGDTSNKAQHGNPQTVARELERFFVKEDGANTSRRDRVL